MRVITGKARGTRLVTVSGNDIVRPTGEKAKEGIFSSIQFDIEGRKILDLFAGSGQLGIEALSRGSKSAVFVDISDVSLKAVRENLTKTGLNAFAEVIKADYSSYLLTSSKKFDIAFLDPPYNSGVLSDALIKTANVMSDFGIIICEHPSETVLPDMALDFKAVKKYKYGKIHVTIYKKEQSL